MSQRLFASKQETSRRFASPKDGAATRACFAVLTNYFRLSTRGSPAGEKAGPAQAGADGATASSAWLYLRVYAAMIGSGSNLPRNTPTAPGYPIQLWMAVA
jgi:hypothetical protein